MRSNILTQATPCGSGLTLKILQERFQVNSVPIRKALARLTGEQLASYYSNIDVSMISLDEQGVKEIYQSVGDLNSLVVNCVSFYPNQEPILGELRENLSLMDTHGLPPLKWQDLSDHFHPIFCDHCQNSRLVHSAQQMRGQMSALAYQYEKQAPEQDLILSGHRMISRLYEAENHQGVVAMMKERLNHSLGFVREMLHSPA